MPPFFFSLPPPFSFTLLHPFIPATPFPLLGSTPLPPRNPLSPRPPHQTPKLNPQGNLLSLRTHLSSPPYSILTPSTSHILHHEAGGVALLTGALIVPIPPHPHPPHLTLAHVHAHASLSSDVHACPTRVLSLENTLNGEILPLDECRRIAAWAREVGVKVHCDGARLWEASVAVARRWGGEGEEDPAPSPSPSPSPAEVLKMYCQCFDSVSLCFSKGLGAPIGSVVVGSEEFVGRARWIRKSVGGG